MNLSNIREGVLKKIFDELEEAFSATGTDFYVIGALAKDVWYARGNKSMRQTKDVDFAVLVSSEENYEKIRQYLKTNKNFADTSTNSFVMFSDSGVQVDILPFGGIEIDEGVHIEGEGLTQINVNGFVEVYRAGTSDIELPTGHHFKIATLPAIILLKLIAFDDRPEHRIKDARDIAGIINHFFDLQADLIYQEHADLFADEKDTRTSQEISAIVIGREIKKICATNDVLLHRLKQILQTHITMKDRSIFIRNMVIELYETVETAIRYLQHMLEAM